MTPTSQWADWLAEVVAEAERQWRELPMWARPVYVPPPGRPVTEGEDDESWTLPRLIVTAKEGD